MTWHVFVSGGPEQPAGAAAAPPPQPRTEGTVFVRSTLPGTGLGHVWHEAGDVVEMSVEHATELVAIEPGRFTAYHEHPDKPTAPPPPDPKDDGGQSSDDKTDPPKLDGPAPEDKTAEDKPKPPAKKTAASRTKVTEPDPSA